MCGCSQRVDTDSSAAHPGFAVSLRRKSKNFSDHWGSGSLLVRQNKDFLPNGLKLFQSDESSLLLLQHYQATDSSFQEGSDEIFQPFAILTYILEMFLRVCGTVRNRPTTTLRTVLYGCVMLPSFLLDKVTSTLPLPHFTSRSQLSGNAFWVFGGVGNLRPCIYI